MLPRTAGHRSGVTATRNLVESAARRGIEVLTVFAFSSENWNRPATEVGVLMDLFLRSLNREVDALSRNGIRLGFVGDRSGFPEQLQTEMTRAEALTAANDRLKFYVAVGYGGRWDIVNAARRIAERAARQELDPGRIDERVLGDELSLAGLPDPDLLIRTGGESRISNFLLWQFAYTELYFCDTLWPDFDDRALSQALEWYASRERRFGRVPETSNERK